MECRPNCRSITGSGRRCSACLDATPFHFTITGTVIARSRHQALDDFVDHVLTQGSGNRGLRNCIDCRIIVNNEVFKPPKDPDPK